MAKTYGAKIMAQALKQQGVDYMFGIVGFPVVPIAVEAQKAGITFIGMRNEQSASYAAQAAAYLTGRPQACLVVSGPGVIHAFAGLANAKENCWPMILIGGASGQDRDGMGDFQEERQVELASPYCKLSRRVEDPRRIPYLVEQAVRTAWYGRPGAAYLDMPDDVILGRVDSDDVPAAPTVAPPPRTLADPAQVAVALQALREAANPLVIVGKGMAWARAEDEVREFIDATKLPFLATPMGKGVVDDNHPLSVGGARSYALQNADTILLLGARLNWILHFGRAPRFNADVKLLQLDVSAETISHNVPATAALVGDGKAVMRQLLDGLAADPFSYDPETPFRAGIAAKIAANEASVAPQVADDSAPMNYYRAFRDIRDWLRDDDIVVGEGSNTMDIGRTQMPNVNARHRLDAATYGTMGIGLGFAVAAAVTNPGKRVVVVQGDSAFGFSGMEMETIGRYKLPIKIVILNNNGIGGGLEEFADGQPVPPNALLPGARYELMADAFGGKGYYVTDPGDLARTLAEADQFDGPAIVHVQLSTSAGRKPQEFSWKS